MQTEKSSQTQMNSGVSDGILDKRANEKKNVPVLVITYFVVLIFICMFAYIIVFIVRDSRTFIANSYNDRQNLYAEKVKKGSIISSDGNVLAETITDGDGNEYRNYPYANMFAHAVGYDSNGQAGLEMNSAYYLLASNQNIITKTYNKLKDEKSIGNNVISTLNYTLQSTAYDALGYNDGAVVVMEPSTGKILTMVSKPDFDPNYIDAYYNLGLILEYLKQNDTALAIFKQIIVRNPTDYESVYKAADLSVKLNELDKAKSYLSLIPPESTVYSKAQSLANSMNTDMQTIKTQEDKVAKTDVHQIDQSNGMYNNIASPTGVTTDKNGNLYVACFSDNMIYKITPDGKRILFVKDAKINGPIALANDNSGNIYVSNYNSNNVVKISPAGAISIQISNVQKPYGLHVADGMLFVSSQGSNSVLRYKL